MTGLYFCGIKKSRIKKTPPFKYLFDLRDKRRYQQIFNKLQGAIEDVSGSEAIVNYFLNEKKLKLYFRKFPCGDLNVLHQVFVEECYRPIVKKILDSFSSGSTLKIIDAGANVGYASIYFNAFFPSAKIIAIEPEEKNLQQLKKNIAVNYFQLEEFVKGALWSQPVFLEVKRDFRDNRDAAFTVQETKNDTGIRGFNFDQVMKKNDWEEVDFVKIDIEGGERFLFNTDENADTILKKTKFLAIEIHDEFHIRKMIYGHLTRNNFEYFESGDLTFAMNRTRLK